MPNNHWESLSPLWEEQDGEIISWSILIRLHSKRQRVTELLPSFCPSLSTKQKLQRLLRTCSACQSGGGCGRAELTQIDGANNNLFLGTFFSSKKSTIPTHSTAPLSKNLSSEQMISTFFLTPQDFFLPLTWGLYNGKCYKQHCRLRYKNFPYVVCCTPELHRLYIEMKICTIKASVNGTNCHLGPIYLTYCIGEETSRTKCTSLRHQAERPDCLAAPPTGRIHTRRILHTVCILLLLENFL